MAIILTPILVQYLSVIPGVMLGELILVFAAIFLMIVMGGKISISKTKPLVFFWFFGMLISMVSFLFQQNIPMESLTRIIRYSFYIYLIILSAKHFKIDYGIKILHLLSVAISVYIILQFIAFNFIGIVLPFKILPFPLYRNVDMQEVFRVATTYYFRPMGVFVEPGFAAQFLLPGLIFSLFGNLSKNKTEYKSAVVIFIAIFLTTSTQGVFFGLIAIAAYLLYNIKSDLKQGNGLKAILLIFIALIAGFYILNMDAIKLAINKVTWAGSAGSSASLRILRGFAVFLSLPFIYKIIGVGHGNLGNFVLEHQIITKYDPIVMTQLAADYANSISMTLLYYGVFGFLILCYIYWKFLRETEKEFRLLVIINVGLIFVAGALFNYLMLYYFAFIYAGYSKRRKGEGTKL
ncbi:hypothetical protein [Sedimentibacter sp.]|uniref:hypothetical protein n=1 Tax=Sedimentibacter sp. TaxID=1960295 RepID=UPI0028AC477F|nr:hypothetical protein [Sedimentibacter sp.]